MTHDNGTRQQKRSWFFFMSSEDLNRLKWQAPLAALLTILTVFLSTGIAMAVTIHNGKAHEAAAYQELFQRQLTEDVEEKTALNISADAWTFLNWTDENGNDCYLTEWRFQQDNDGHWEVGAGLKPKWVQTKTPLISRTVFKLRGGCGGTDKQQVERLYYPVAASASVTDSNGGTVTMVNANPKESGVPATFAVQGERLDIHATIPK